MQDSIIISIVSSLILIILFLIIKIGSVKQKLREERLRYSVLKKQSTLEGENILRLLDIVKSYLVNNPVGILNTTNGKLVRRSFEIKQTGKIECRRRKKGVNNEVKRAIVPLTLAYELNSGKEFITKNDLIGALGYNSLHNIITKIRERTVVIEESSYVETP
jgi:hypothetical protein